VVHTVGPIWQGGERGEAEQLASCYRRSAQVAVASGAESLAFPQISTGVYSYPMAEACDIATRELHRMVQDYPALQRVVCVCFNPAGYQAMGAAMTRFVMVKFGKAT
jgi:O-acetyl-ADP-ribose deacetylase (regulator of RNase III)